MVHIGDATQKLSVHHQQLVARGREFSDSDNTAPLEDIALLVLSTLNGLELDLYTLQRAAAHRTGVVVCDEGFMPTGILLPLFGAWNHTEVLHGQIEASRPTKKRAWQRVVQEKIRQQAQSLPPDHRVAKRLIELAGQVRSGDAGNTEAIVARIYWPALMGPNFRRMPRTRLGPNGALDYGYAIMRSLVARCLVGVGLHPALGIFHHGRSNPFCLVDDLVEPLRPVVDRVVAAEPERFMGDLDPECKEVLRQLLNQEFTCGDHQGLLTTACSRYAESFRNYLLGDGEEIKFPRAAHR